MGYGIQILFARGVLKPAFAPGDLRKALQRAALLFFNPIAVMAAIWSVDLTRMHVAAMPLIGLSALFCGGFLSYLGARIYRLPPRQAGAYIMAGAMSNIGSIGGLVVYVYLGEAAFAYVPFYKLLEALWYYGICFPAAKSFGAVKNAAEPPGRRPMRALSDPFVIVASLGIGTGFALNLAGVERPVFFAMVTAAFVPIGSLLLLASIGMAIRFERIPRYLREAGLLALIKFGLIPGIALSMAAAAGLGKIDGGLPLKVVLILSAMPTAFTALVPPTLYGLDVDLANACWLVTTGLLIAILPLLILVLRLL